MLGGLSVSSLVPQFPLLSSSPSSSKTLLSVSSSHSLGRSRSSLRSSTLPVLTAAVSFRFSSPGRNLRLCRAGEYIFPDPIPEFADAETEKFRTHLLRTLSESDKYGESCKEVVDVCTEIFSEFLHAEYGGPGTLLVIPFIDMADTLRERGLPGAGEAAEEAVGWAREHVDKDWDKWTGSD